MSLSVAHQMPLAAWTMGVAREFHAGCYLGVGHVTPSIVQPTSGLEGLTHFYGRNDDRTFRLAPSPRTFELNPPWWAEHGIVGIHFTDAHDRSVMTPHHLALSRRNRWGRR